MSLESSSQAQKFQCGICGKSYRKKDSLTRHSHNHQDGQRLVCWQCSRNFHRRDILQRHLALHHTGRTRSVQACERCRVCKVRCDSKTPCSRCAKVHQDCTYSTPVTNAFMIGGVSISGSTLSESPSHHRQPANGDQLYSPSWSRPSATGETQASIVAECAHLSPAKINTSIEGRVSDQRSSLESNTTNMTMENAANPLIWCSAGHLPWSSTDLFLNSMDLCANNEIPLNTIDNAIFEFEDNCMSTAQTAKKYQPLLDALTLDSDDSLAAAMEFSYFNIGPTVYMPISSFDRSFRSGNSKNLEYSPQPVAQRELRVPCAHARINNLLQDIVKEMTEFAVQNVTASVPFSLLKDRSREFSSRIQICIPEAENMLSRSSSPHLLHHFCSQFMAHFNPLWPLIRPDGFEMDSTLPVLYLTTASIGAMYSGTKCSQLGLMIHENLRMALLTTPLLHGQASYSLECLQSLLLTEISTVYFGPRSALPIAQRIGAMVVLQARAMGIFSGRAFAKHNNVAPTLEQWSHREGTIRVVFGIFRAEAFISVLLNSPLLVSAEEINLDLPCSDNLWMGSVDEQRTSLKARDHSSLIYSDLVRIAMDRSEIMPDLGVAHRELVLYGGQESIWRFSHDSELFPRTMEKESADHLSFLNDSPDGEFFTWPARRQSRDGVVEDSKPLTATISLVETPPQDHLDCSPRRMVNLQRDYNRMMMFLHDWKSSFIGNQSSRQLEGSRYNLLNSRLLYHLSLLRLRTDLQALNLLTTEHDDILNGEKDDAVYRVWQWSKTMSAGKALEHACAIWVLVASESTWKGGNRARFNILCLIALHCASKVVWAYAGAHTSPRRGILKMPTASTEFSGADVPVCRENSQSLMECFDRLFHVVTKGWVSWFPETVMLMAKSPLPLPHVSEATSP